MREKGKLPLALLREGEKGIIMDFDAKFFEREFAVPYGTCGQCCSYACRQEENTKKIKFKRLKDMGFERGREIEVLKNQPGQPLIVRLENSQIALNRGLAMKILVSKEV